MAEQGYLAPLDHGAGSSCRSLYALASMFPPKLSSHPPYWVGQRPKRAMSSNGVESSSYTSLERAPDQPQRCPHYPTTRRRRQKLSHKWHERTGFAAVKVCESDEGLARGDRN